MIKHSLYGWDQYSGVESGTGNKSQARVGDIIVIRSGLKKIGNKSAVFRQQIINKGTKTVCVDADITFVIADIIGKPIKLEGGLKEKLLQLPLFEG